MHQNWWKFVRNISSISNFGIFTKFEVLVHHFANILSSVISDMLFEGWFGNGLTQAMYDHFEFYK